MGIEPTEDDSHRPPPVLKTGPVTRSGRATGAESNSFRFAVQQQEGRGGLLRGLRHGCGLRAFSSPPSSVPRYTTLPWVAMETGSSPPSALPKGVQVEPPSE